MRSRRIAVQMAHIPGHCALAQTPDGHHLFTSGVDATLRLHDIRPTLPGSGSSTSWWQGDTPSTEPDLGDVPASDANHTKPITALALSASGTTLASCSTDGFVRFFSVSQGSSAPKLTFLQACARFSAPARALAFSGSGAFTAIAGEEPGLIKVIMTAQPTNINVMRVTDKKSPAYDAIVALAFDKKGDYIATVGERGCAAVWDVEKAALLAVVDLNGRKARCVTWAPDDTALLFGTDRGAVVVSRSRWFVDFQLEDVSDGGDDDDDDDGDDDGGDDDDDIFGESHGSQSQGAGNGNKSGAKGGKKKDVRAVDWCSNARYVLTASKDGNVTMWDVVDRKVLGIWKVEHVAQAVQWHNKANAFIVVDQNGQWGIADSVVPPHLPSPTSKVASVELPQLPDDASVSKKKKKKKKTEEEDDDEDEDTVNPVKRSKAAEAKRKKLAAKRQKGKDKGSKKSTASTTNDDDNEDDGNGFSLSDVDADDEEEANRSIMDSQGMDSEEDGDDEDDSEDDEELPGELAGLENAGVQLPDLPASTKRNRKKGAAGKGSGANGALSFVSAQPIAPFMPGSTPASEKASKKVRILVWNLVGAVLSFDENTHDVVEVEFSDASKRSVGIKDHYGYTLGCLSELGVLLASPRTKDHGSLVTFRPFSAWALNADWTQFMPEGEDVSVLALGQQFAAVVTTPHHVVRIFSLSGIQCAVYGVNGHIVSACATGNTLAIVYQADTRSAALRVEVVQLTSGGDVDKVVYDGALKTGHASSLEWVGFTNDTADLCAYDSAGWLWVLTDVQRTQRWVPLVQGAARHAQCDWLWAAAATSESIIGAACLSNERFPPAKPRPGLRTVPATAPVVDRVTKAGKATVAERLARTKLRLQRAVATRAVLEAELEGEEDEDDDELQAADEDVARLELEVDKCILSMMEEACRRENNMRALDLSTRLNSKLSFKYAIELAKHFKRAALVTRVERVAQQKIAILEDDMRSRQRRSIIQSQQLDQHHVQEDQQEQEQELELEETDQSTHDRDKDKKSRVQASATTRGTKQNKSDGAHAAVKRLPNGNARVVGKKKGAKPVVMSVADVTDDEEEEEGGTDEGRRRRETAASKGRGTKRRVDDEESSTTTAKANSSQSMAKTNSNTNTATSTKKAKVSVTAAATTTANGESTASANPRFASFKNRFLKK